MATWHKELTHWKRPWCWERLRAGGEGDNRGCDGWLASPTQWTWVWAKSGREWRKGRPGMLQSMGSQRMWHDLGIEQQQRYISLSPPLGLLPSELLCASPQAWAVLKLSFYVSVSPTRVQLSLEHESVAASSQACSKHLNSAWHPVRAQETFIKWRNQWIAFIPCTLLHPWHIKYSVHACWAELSQSESCSTKHSAWLQRSVVPRALSKSQ